MLVLTRKRDELIRIGDEIVIRVIRTAKGSVKLGVDAPVDIKVLRGEVALKLDPNDDSHEISSRDAVLLQH